MKLQTTVIPRKDEIAQSHSNKVLLVGSCFTDSIGEKLDYFGFRCMRNPFGILYNPFSIAQCLEYCIVNRKMSDDDIVFNNHLWHSWYHHSKFSDVSKEKCVENCNIKIEEAHLFLKDVDYIFITWGTALIYTLIEQGIVVGNCHKIPGTYFDRRLLMVEEIAKRYMALEQKLLAYNPKAEILLTVSPIRHWKEGYRENQLSKSVLHLAVDKLQSQSAMYHYFPSYEIVMDELRDYRFFEADMLHPSAVAIEIIWEKFLDAYTSEGTKNICAVMDKYQKMKQHRPFYPDSDDYKAHQSKMAQIECRLKELVGQDFLCSVGK